MSMPFKNLLADFLEKSGLSKTDLAKRIGVGVSYISHLESGHAKPPTAERCRQIAEVLRLSDQDTKTLLRAAALERAPEETRSLLDGQTTSGRPASVRHEQRRERLKAPIGVAPALEFSNIPQRYEVHLRVVVEVISAKPLDD